MARYIDGKRTLEVTMLRLVRPFLVALVLVIAGIWLLGWARAIFSSTGLLLVVALVAVLYLRRHHRAS
ncbi:MAG: hypothetical protein ACYCXN_00180 [Acidimicrobiales bacterium]